MPHWARRADAMITEKFVSLHDLAGPILVFDRERVGAANVAHGVEDPTNITQRHGLMSLGQPATEPPQSGQESRWGRSSDAADIGEQPRLSVAAGTKVSRAGEGPRQSALQSYSLSRRHVTILAIDSFSKISPELPSGRIASATRRGRLPQRASQSRAWRSEN
jgi:hypothetical protein